jgi:hypothetical protein
MVDAQAEERVVENLPEHRKFICIQTPYRSSLEEMQCKRSGEQMRLYALFRYRERATGCLSGQSQS